jgi:hypothetical protein
MGGARPSVVVHGADESLRSLLSDVLGDMGLALRSPGEARPDVVLTLVQQGEAVQRVLQAAGGGVTPVLVLLPFEDERLRHLVLGLGARGCYALGTPLEELKRLLREVVRESPCAREVR